VGDAAAARRDALETALVQRLKEDKDRTWPLRILKLNQLLAALDRAGGDVILHIDDNQRNDLPWLGDASRFREHSYLHHLGFNLTDPALQPTLAGVIRNHHAGRSHDLGDKIARPKEELFDPP